MPLPAKCAYCAHDLLARWRRPVFSVCGGCGLVRRDPMPAERELDSLYAGAWQNPPGNPAETGGTADSHARDYVRELIRTCALSPGASVLDYGAGRGAVLHRLRETGFNAVGIEPYGLSTLREQGFAAYADLAALPPDMRFDCIFSNDVIEHLSHPWSVLPDLLGRLEPGGCIVVSTPNPDGLRARLAGANWREAANPGHLCFLTPGLLARLLREAGFVQPRLLFWNVRYTANPLKNGIHRALCRLGLGGVSRVVAFSAGTSP